MLTAPSHLDCMFVTPDERRFDQDGDAYADCGISTRREGKTDAFLMSPLDIRFRVMNSSTSVLAS